MTTTVGVEPKRVCSRCHRRKPWSEFYARTRWPDGSMRCPRPECKECHNAMRVAMYRANPETKSEANRRYREAVQSDPERLARHRETQRAARVAFEERRGRAARVGARTRLRRGDRLPAGPFIAWLKTLSPADLNDLPIGKSTRLELLSGGRGWVTIDTVDRCCLHLDVRIDDLYPMEDAA